MIAGTVMHGTHLPHRTWFIKADLAATHSNLIRLADSLHDDPCQQRHAQYNADQTNRNNDCHESSVGYVNHCTLLLRASTPQRAG